MAKQQITVPDIGGAEGAEVIELLVAAGDQIELEQGLLVLESDKASMEIPSTLAGKVLQVLVKVGDELSEGHPIVVVETEAEADAEAEPEPESSADTAEFEGESPAGEAVQDAEVEPVAADQASSDSGVPSEVTVEVPDIGTDDAVDVIELCVKPGDEVAEGDSLVVLESDKASMEVPSPRAGKVIRMLVKEGAAVREGDPRCCWRVWVPRMSRSRPAPAATLPRPVRSRPRLMSLWRKHPRQRRQPPASLRPEAAKTRWYTQAPRCGSWPVSSALTWPR